FILLGLTLPEPDGTIDCFFPLIDEGACTRCGNCASTCRFHALFQVEDKLPVLIEPLCKSCELCMRICPEGAISERKELIGEHFSMEVNPSLDLEVGRLIPGSAKTTMVIISLVERLLTKHVAGGEYDYIIIDSAPGAHCDVEHALSETDMVFCVTEPTPLGRHDLGRILELLSFIGKPAKIIVNRFDMVEDDSFMDEYCGKNGVEIVSKIPLSRDVMETYARGTPIVGQAGQLGADHPVIREFANISEVLRE
ncbi:hypothetical protein GF325_05335, partial [Candidatus Bathyarchaeota archaeon]|nr:hypothetical protein [Candidatus Bathyarchaeota archaeon]